jgi:hypothetical protein
MDTRSKIVSATDALRLAHDGATVVSGYFDPMTAAHAQRLAGFKRNGTPLLVLIADPPDKILPAAARAELVASLRAVDHVAIAHGGPAPQYRLEQEDATRLVALIAHVHSRQNAGS